MTSVEDRDAEAPQTTDFAGHLRTPEAFDDRIGKPKASLPG